jgi:signal transduction histidine kinase
MPTLRAVPRLAWAAGGAVVVAHVIITLLDAFGVYREEFELGGLPLLALTAALWAAIAIVAVANPRTRRFGWLVVVMAWAQPWILAALPGDLLWSLSWATWSTAYGVVTHLFVAYPTGRIVSRRDRALVAAGYVFWIGFPVARMLVWDPDAEFGCRRGIDACMTNVFAVGVDMGLVSVLDWTRIVVTALLAALIVLAVRRHAASVSAAARRAYVPVAIAAVVQHALIVTDLAARELALPDVIDVLGSPAFGLVWDIVPIGFLAGLFATRLSRGRVAALALELVCGIPTGSLRELLARTLQDPTVELAFPDPAGSGFVDVEGRPMALPPPDDPSRAVASIEREGRTLALLIHDPAIDEDDPELVRAVGSVAQMALVNERLTAQVRAQLEEVRASRARVAEAADAERLRIEQELHDGAQRRLEDLTLRLEAARSTSAEAAALIDRTTSELRAAIAEVGGLARGLQPALLADAGLAGAVGALAAAAPIPVEVEVPPRRYAPAVESAAYFVVAEALTNVARYARATGVRVEIREDDGALTIRVTDDGLGGADPARGSGLRGMLDRVAAAGGSLLVDSPPGRGTSLTARLPVAGTVG